ncbi:unnamed protein product [Caenorhabditis angaria]|uniref:Uncharacterized protein n=1 Tax=Caenorhabditis angaria TaxID=860376 RepID=A0A9P1IZF1_9PELO|nr:unnamed protein product [Caenorhabditis angaria]
MSSYTVLWLVYIVCMCLVSWIIYQRVTEQIRNYLHIEPVVRYCRLIHVQKPKSDEELERISENDEVIDFGFENCEEIIVGDYVNNITVDCC